MGSKNGKPVLREEDIATLTETSELSESQINAVFDEFVEKHPNGKISPKEFQQMMAKALPKKDASKMEKNVFRLYDSNNDGFIDFTEFTTVYLIMSNGSPEEVLSKIFRVFDVDGNGFISLKELKKITTDLYGLLKKENPNLASKEMIGKLAFAEMDKDQDGRVSLQEFIGACLGQEEFSRMLTSKIIDIFVEDE